MADRKEQYLNVDAAPTLYVNSVQIAQTPFDLRLRLGLIHDATADTLVTQVLATVFMAPLHAKIFAHILNKHIAKYEKLNGPLPPVPAALVESEVQAQGASDGSDEEVTGSAGE